MPTKSLPQPRNAPATRFVSELAYSVQSAVGHTWPLTAAFTQPAHVTAHVRVTELQSSECSPHFL